LKIRRIALAERTKRCEELLDLVGLAGLGIATRNRFLVANNNALLWRGRSRISRQCSADEPLERWM
jgi:hypothetical protein